MTAFHKILVPVDFEECSKRALEFGIDLAKQFGASLTVFHAWNLPPYPYTSLASQATLLKAIGEAAQERLDVWLAEAKKTLPSVTGILKRGTPWEEVVAAIEETGADLVVTGTHGRRGLPHMLLGSVAEKIIRLSPVPVLTIPTAARSAAPASG